MSHLGAQGLGPVRWSTTRRRSQLLWPILTPFGCMYATEHCDRLCLGRRGTNPIKVRVWLAFFIFYYRFLLFCLFKRYSSEFKSRLLGTTSPLKAVGFQAKHILLVFRALYPCPLTLHSASNSAIVSSDRSPVSLIWCVCADAQASAFAIFPKRYFQARDSYEYQWNRKGRSHKQSM